MNQQNLNHHEKAELRGSKSETEWNAVLARITAKRKGGTPADLYDFTETSGLRAAKQATFALQAIGFEAVQPGQCDVDGGEQGLDLNIRDALGTAYMQVCLRFRPGRYPTVRVIVKKDQTNFKFGTYSIPGPVDGPELTKSPIRVVRDDQD